jgi:AraC-like DNA-binding protein
VREKLEIPAKKEGEAWKHQFHPVIQPHRHDELEINFVIKGRASCLVDEKKYDLRPQTQIWLFPNQEHVLLDQSSDLQMWILIFKPRMIRKLCSSDTYKELTKADPPSDFCRQLSLQVAANLNGQFEELAKLAGDIDRFNSGLGYAMLNAWAAHLEAERPTVGADVHPAVEKAARLLQGGDDINNVESLASQSGLSASRLSRLFKKQTGVSLVDFRNRQRIEKVLKAYGRGQRVTMLQAALDAGFGSYIQFYRVFSKVMKCTPAEYRRSQTLS